LSTSRQDEIAADGRTLSSIPDTNRSKRDHEERACYFDEGRHQVSHSTVEKVTHHTKQTRTKAWQAAYARLYEAMGFIHIDDDDTIQYGNRDGTKLLRPTLLTSLAASLVL